MLTSEAYARLVRLGHPYLRLALDDPFLFDDNDHPAIDLLSQVVDLWDANIGASDADAEFHGIANAAADAIANDYHGNTAIFDQILARLNQQMQPLVRRREIAERRARQSILGRERLHAARQEADAQLKQLLEGRELLPSIAQLLDDQWRQSLTHLWMRKGRDSDRCRDALAVADATLQVDSDAAQAKGAAVAANLFKLQEAISECFAASGLDQSTANATLAALVAEVAQRDTTRIVHGFTPSAATDDETGAGSESPLTVEQVAIQRKPGAPPQWLRVAWTSPLSGQYLLVNRQGVRQALNSPVQIAAAIEAGQREPHTMVLASKTCCVVWPEGPAPESTRVASMQPIR